MPENILITSKPPKIALLDEGLHFEISSTRSWMPSSADLYTRFPDTYSAYLNKYFEISLPDRNLKFYFKTTPDSSGLELTTMASGQTIINFLNQLVTELQKNYYINSNYTVARTAAPGISFEAKNSGPCFDIDFVGTDVSGLQKISAGAGDEGSNPGDYRIYIAPYLYPGGEAIGEDLLTLNASMVATINLADYFQDKLKSSFNFPVSSGNIFAVADAVHRYYVRYAEYMNSALQKVLDNYSDELYVIAGGLKQLDSDFLKLKGYNYFDYDEGTKKFLTWAPLEKVTYPEVPERLYFLLTGNTDVNLFYKKNDDEFKALVQTFPAAPYSIIEVACGSKDLFPNGGLFNSSSYEIWLEDDDDNIISEKRTFTIDYSNYLNKRTFFFQNSFGMYDTLTCVGNISIEDKIEREEIEVKKGGVFRRKYTATENIPQWNISTGWLANLETRLWLQELLLTKDAYLAIGSMVLPVLIKSGEVMRQADRKYLHELSFSFEPDYRNQRYSAIASADGGDYVLADEEWQILMDENGYTLLDTP